MFDNIDFQFGNNYNLLMQKQSQTEQLIHRANYRKHKAKLQQIRKHNTSLQFYNSGPNRPEDKKKLMMLKVKREEIELENKKLRDKIDKMNRLQQQSQPVEGANGQRKKIISQSMGKPGQFSTNKSGYKNRYINLGDEDDIIEVNSDCDGDQLKCIVPNHYGKKKNLSYSLHKSQYNTLMNGNNSARGKLPQLKIEQKLVYNQQPEQQAQNQSDTKVDLQGEKDIENKQKEEENDKEQINKEENIQKLDNIEEKQFDKNLGNQMYHEEQGISDQTFDLGSIKKLKKIVRTKNLQEGDDFLYNQPERQAHRIVLFRKTKIPQPMLCYVIELSLIDRRILIMANGMGLQNKDHRFLMDRKRSKQLLDWSQGDYSKIWQRVQITHGGIRISEQSEQTLINRKEQLQQNRGQRIYNKIQAERTKKLQITQDFIQRNYYIIKQSVNTKEDPNASIQNHSLGDSKVKRQSNTGSFFRNKIQYHREQARNTSSFSKQKDTLKNQNNQKQTQNNQNPNQNKKTPATHNKNMQKTHAQRKSEQTNNNSKKLAQKNIKNRQDKQVSNKSIKVIEKVKSQKNNDAKVPKEHNKNEKNPSLSIQQKQENIQEQKQSKGNIKGIKYSEVDKKQTEKEQISEYAQEFQQTNNNVSEIKENMSEVKDNVSDVKKFEKNKSKLTDKNKNDDMAEQYEEAYSDGGDFQEEVVDDGVNNEKGGQDEYEIDDFENQTQNKNKSAAMVNQSSFMEEQIGGNQSKFTNKNDKKQKQRRDVRQEGMQEEYLDEDFDE